MLKEISNVLGFDFELVNPIDKEWGALTNGIWSGNIGCAASGKCDIILGAIILSPLRFRILRSTTPFDKDTVTFATGIPRPLVNYLSLLNPFSKLVWFTILFAFIIFSSFIWALARWETLTYSPRNAVYEFI